MRKLIGFVVIGSLPLLFSSPAFALDELYLCGVVNGINARDGVVSVDVASEGCRGLRTFRLPAKLGLTLKAKKRICFFIDRNRCQASYVHTITKILPE